MPITEDMLARTTKDWSEIAGEPVAAENIGGTIYGFCSELGALRLAYKYRHGNPDRVKAANSENRGSWYFRLEPRHQDGGQSNG